jgi:signal transduction histidine kinase
MNALPRPTSDPALTPAAPADASLPTAEYGRTRRPPRVPWYVVYYLLAAFDFLTVTALLYLNHRSVAVFVRSVDTNQRWARTMAAFTELGQFAAAVNAPGNDVFDSGRVAEESERMERALQAMRERLSSLRGDLLAHGSEPETALLLDGMDAVEEATLRMAEQARSIFTHFAAGRRAQAGQQMASMDRSYNRLLVTLRAVSGEVSRIQAQAFARQTEAIVSFQRAERVGAGLILVMLVAAVAYGRKIAGHAERERRDRRRHITQFQEVQETLRRAHAEMERRVEERTRALRESEVALRRAATEWQSTFEAIESPVLVLDLAGRVLRLNHAAAQLAGRPAPLGQVGSLGAGEPWRSVAEVVNAVRDGRASSWKQAREASDGRTWDISGSLVAQPDPREERVIVVARDVTRLVELQESVGREERMSAMGSLVAGVAHEVRNPLFGISSTLDAFESRHGGRGEFDKYLGVLKQEVERLRALMQDLLDYGRPPTLDLASVDVEELAEEAIRACEALAREAKVEIVKGRWELGRAALDRSRMLQVIQNLIQNAVQHSPPGGRVALDAGRSLENGRSWLWLSVRDAGPGFEAVDLRRVFEPFYTRRRGGTGLGLSIAQRIVSQHGGVLTAANHPEGGALVGWRLPADGPGGGA